MGRASGKVNGLNCVYIVARYKPKGNVLGSFKANVLQGNFNQGICTKLDDIIKIIPSTNVQKIISPGNVDTGNVGNTNTPIGRLDKGMGNVEIKVDESDNEEERTPAILFDESGLQAHNRLRRIHGASALKIDPTLSKDAQAYADYLQRYGKLMVRINRADVGENLAVTCSTKKDYDMTAEEAIKNW